MKETDLYPPIKAYLEANDYLVRAEVNDCDIVAVKDEDAFREQNDRDENKAIEYERGIWHWLTPVSGRG